MTRNQLYQHVKRVRRYPHPYFIRIGSYFINLNHDGKVYTCFCYEGHLSVARPTIGKLVRDIMAWAALAA